MGAAANCRPPSAPFFFIILFSPSSPPSGAARRGAPRCDFAEVTISPPSSPHPSNLNLLLRLFPEPRFASQPAPSRPPFPFGRLPSPGGSGSAAGVPQGLTWRQRPPLGLLCTPPLRAWPLLYALCFAHAPLFLCNPRSLHPLLLRTVPLLCTALCFVPAFACYPRLLAQPLLALPLPCTPLCFAPPLCFASPCFRAPPLCFTSQVLCISLFFAPRLPAAPCLFAPPWPSPHCFALHCPIPCIPPFAPHLLFTLLALHPLRFATPCFASSLAFRCTLSFICHCTLPCFVPPLLYTPLPPLALYPYCLHHPLCGTLLLCTPSCIAPPCLHPLGLLPAEQC